MRLLIAALDDAATRKVVADAATAAGALTSPWWLDLIHYGYQGAMAGGAAILLGLRLAVAYREWRQGKKP